MPSENKNIKKVNSWIENEIWTSDPKENSG